MILLTKQNRKTRRQSPKAWNAIITSGTKTRKALVPYATIRIGQSIPSRGITWRRWHIAKEYEKGREAKKIIPKKTRLGLYPMPSMCGEVRLYDTAEAPEELFIRAAGDKGAVCYRCLTMITEKVDPDDLDPVVKKQLRSIKNSGGKNLGKRRRTGRNSRTAKSHGSPPETDSPTEQLKASSQVKPESSSPPPGAQ